MILNFFGFYLFDQVNYVRTEEISGSVRRIKVETKGHTVDTFGE